MKRPEYKKQHGSIEDFKDYEKLISRVRKVNPEAADKLAEMGKTLTSNFWYECELSASFLWDVTPDGWAYWRRICGAIGEMGRYGV